MLKAISYIKSKETVTYKKVTMRDLMISEKNYDDENKNRNNNVKSFRQWEEFGLKTVTNICEKPKTNCPKRT